METIKIKSIKLSSKNKSLLFSDGNLLVDLRTAEKKLDAKLLHLSVYRDDFFYMCGGAIERKGRSGRLVAEVSDAVWMSGGYKLYVCYNDVAVLHADFTIDENLDVTDIRECPCHDYDAGYVVVNMLDFCDITMPEPESEDLEEVGNPFEERPQKQPIAKGWNDLKLMFGGVQLRKAAIYYNQVNLISKASGLMSSGKDVPIANYMIVCNDYSAHLYDIERFYNSLTHKQDINFYDCSKQKSYISEDMYEQTENPFYSTLDKTIVVTNLSYLIGERGNSLVKKLTDVLKCKTKTIWLCGTNNDYNALFQMYPTLKEFFHKGNRLDILPYTPFELVRAFLSELRDSCITIDSDVSEQLIKTLMEEYKKGTFKDWTKREISKYIKEEVCPSFFKRAIEGIEKGEPYGLKIEDFHFEIFSKQDATFEESIRELNEMVGLDNIKRSITTMANRTKFSLERKRLGLSGADNAVYHSVFTGNPGTGKTTVARMLGKIYHSLGLLSKGNVVSVDRKQIVGRYLGETEANIKNIIETAKGSVLFIDEAYTLYVGDDDNKDFGHRALECLLSVLTEPNPDMIIIFAGYAKEMDMMLTSNPGLIGRFPYKFHFEDYSAEQLMEIARRKLKQEDFVLTADAETLLKNTICQTTAQKNKCFGNARWIEQYVENGIISEVADRISGFDFSKLTRDDYRLVTKADVEKAFEKFNLRQVSLRPIMRIGFSA